MAGAALGQSTSPALVLTAPGWDSTALIRALRAQSLPFVAIDGADESALPDTELCAALLCAPALTSGVRSLARRLRLAYPRLPLLLWAEHPGAAVQEVLDAGIDVWVPGEAPAPAAVRQLIAIMRLVPPARREPAGDVITVRQVRVDLGRKEVAIDDQPVPLTPTEFRIVAQLARRPGRVVSHADLFHEVHGYDASEQEAKDILKVHIWRLRTKLAAAGGPEDLIVNVRGFGYLLERRSRGDRSTVSV